MASSGPRQLKLRIPFRSPSAGALQLVSQKLHELLRGELVQLSSQEKVLISRQITDMVMGLGPLEEFLSDTSITEIMVNGPDHVYVEREGKLSLTGASFHNEEQL